MAISTVACRRGHRACTPRRVARTVRVIRLAPLVVLLGAIFITTPPARSAGSHCIPKVRTPIDLVFILDRSGSMEPSELGASYNIQVDGVARALRDASIIPRDGSVAVSVQTVPPHPSLERPFTVIGSADIAEAEALGVEAFECRNPPEDPCPSCGPRPESNFGDAILRAHSELERRGRPGAHRVLILSTDGECSDPDGDCGRDESTALRSELASRGIPSQLDVILLGIGAERKAASSCPNPPVDLGVIEQIVFNSGRGDSDAGPLIIEPGPCNDFSQRCTEADRRRQVEAFADRVRRTLRSHVTPITLTVDTGVDPDPNTAVGATLSLRQAIELANARGGNTKITFDFDRVFEIQPKTPLPALCAPEIEIDGCFPVKIIIDRAPMAANVGSDASIDDRCSHRMRIDLSAVDVTKGEQHFDGILIRSNRCTVRGLDIRGFKRAGVAVEPRCPFDNTGGNRIELNTIQIELNTIQVDGATAGVVILNPALTNEPTAVRHNVGNTISRNEIIVRGVPSRRLALIDLTLIDRNGDGPTPNDGPSDEDEGPNTLLNTPEDLSVVAIEAGRSEVGLRESVVKPQDGLVTVTGVVDHPGTVEVFEVTELNIKDFGDGPVLAIEGVVFRVAAPVATKGPFSIAGLAPSRTGAFTATLTDEDGNTSELTLMCGGMAQALVTLDRGEEKIKFGSVDPGADPPAVPEERSFRITNVGCSPLPLKGFVVTRMGEDVESKRIIRPDDGELFDVRALQQGSEVPVGPNLSVQPADTLAFRVRFKPAIPRIVFKDEETAAGGLSASQTLPEPVRSVISFNRSSTEPINVVLVGHVGRAVKIIPNRNPSPDLVRLTRSGDELTVEFSIFDSNLDVNQPQLKVLYRFFGSGGREIRVKPPDTDLAEAIRMRGLVQGQSFTVIQRFVNANEHPDVERVEVRVTDPERTVSGSGELVSTSSSAIRPSMLQTGSGVVIPAVQRMKTIGRSSRTTHDGGSAALLERARREKSQ